MTHYSPLKKLFRRQKALAGMRRLVESNQPRQEVLVMCKPFYFVMNQRDFDQHRDAIGKLMEGVCCNTQWSEAAAGELPDGTESEYGQLSP